MKRLLICALCAIFLMGCSAENGIDQTMKLRQQLLQAEECSFKAAVVADYGDILYTFSMHCNFDNLGNMAFTIEEPTSIKGITGTINNEKGFLTFSDQLVAFPLLADGQLSPVSAPWVLMKSIRSGYIHSSVREEELLHVYIDDSFEDDALQLELWLNTENRPVQAEILYKNCRILSLKITDFAYV